jgi:hypothetical protein
MAGTFSVKYDIPSDVETAYAAISGGDWAPTKSARLGDGSKVVSRTEDGDAVTIVYSRNLPDGIPGFLKKFLPADGQAGQTDSWAAPVDGVRHGTWVAGTPGLPGKVDGTMRLEPAPSGCRYVVEGTAKISIPLVGGKAEGFIIGMTEKITAKEADVLRAMVS